MALIAIAGVALSGFSLGDDAGAARPARPNVVLVVFDEFGGDILLGPNGRIDAGRFPHFAALARDGTWFRNAQTRSDGPATASCRPRRPRRCARGATARTSGSSARRSFPS